MHRFAALLALFLVGPDALAAPPVAMDPGARHAALGSCRHEAQRNAKLYALRVQGVKLMRTSQRVQAASTISLDDRMEQLRASLADQPSLARDADQALEALTTLTDLTVQEAQAGQVSAAGRLADQASDACARLIAALRSEPTGAQRPVLQALGEMLFLSQRIARRFLATPLGSAPSAATRSATTADLTMFEKWFAALKPVAAADPKLGELLPLVDAQLVFQRNALASPLVTRQSLEYAGGVSEALYQMLAAEMIARGVR